MARKIRTIIYTVLLVGIGLVFLAGWLSDRDLQRKKNQLQDIISDLAKTNPDFSAVRASVSSHPKLVVAGFLPRQGEIDLLKRKITERFGDFETAHLLFLVSLDTDEASEPTTDTGTAKPTPAVVSPSFPGPAR